MYTDLIFETPEGQIRLTIENKDLERMIALMTAKGVSMSVEPIKRKEDYHHEDNHKRLRDGDLRKIFLYQLKYRVGYLEAKEALLISGKIKYED